MATIDVVASWPGGERRWRFGGDCGPDDVVKVGTIDIEVPATLGALTIDLVLSGEGVHATNHYGAVITAVPT